MKTVVNDQKKPVFKKLGLLSIGFCALPIIGTVIGAGALSTVAVYLEKAGIAALFASGGLFALWQFNRKKTTSSCDDSCDNSAENSCGCKTENSLIK
jgi:hypothetical protein